MERPIRNGDAMTLALWEECRNIQRFVKEETETDFSDIQKERAAQLWETASEEWESVPRTVEDYLQMKPAESHLFLPAEEEGHDDNTEALRRWKIDVRQVRDKMTRMIPPDGEGVTADRETALLYCAQPGSVRKNTQTLQISCGMERIKQISAESHELDHGPGRQRGK